MQIRTQTLIRISLVYLILPLEWLDIRITMYLDRERPNSDMKVLAQIYLALRIYVICYRH